MRKMTEDLKYIFGVLNDPELRSPRPMFNRSLKLVPIDMFTKTDAQQIEIVFTKWAKPEFWSILGPKVA